MQEGDPDLYPDEASGLDESPSFASFVYSEADSVINIKHEPSSKEIHMAHKEVSLGRN